MSKFLGEEKAAIERTDVYLYIYIFIILLINYTCANFIVFKGN
jgi:hypothetical protein